MQMCLKVRSDCPLRTNPDKSFSEILCMMMTIGVFFELSLVINELLKFVLVLVRA